MANTAKHTPGPWEVVGSRICTVGNDRERVTLAKTEPSGAFTMSTEQTANAHLIAAAPAMYEALEHAAMSCHHPACKCKGEYASQPERYCTCHVQKARQAIAQAEGRQA